jgi:hypothetical protein
MNELIRISFVNRFGQGWRNFDFIAKWGFYNLQSQLGGGGGFSRERNLILRGLNREGCLRSTQLQLGTWKPFQHLLEDRGKPRKPVSEVEGRVTFLLHNDF